MRLSIGSFNAPYLPLLAWLLALAAFMTLVVESVFVESHALFVYARVAAYIAALMASAMVIGLVALFGLCCGLMLWWLDDALPVKRVANAVLAALWVAVAYTGLGIVLLLIEPPAGIGVADAMQRQKEFEAEMQELLAYRWMRKLSYVVGGGYLLVVAWLLARLVRPWNAAIAVAFGAAAVAALMAALSAISAPEME